MNTSDKIAVVALIASLISVSFTGLTYLSNEASKRDEVGIFILRNQYAIRWDNSSNAYKAVFFVSGVVTNEGPRRCQVGQLILHVILPVSESMKEYYNMSSSAQTINFQEVFVNDTSNILDWDNTVFDVGSQRNFTLTMTLNGLSDSNLQSTDIQGSIHLEYTDLLGVLVKDQTITNWVQISALF